MAGVERIRELGLDNMEVEFVRGVHMGAEKQKLVAEAARRLDVQLSAHGPYFINLNSDEKVKIEASVERILQTARAGYGCSATTVTFHAATYMKGDPKIAHKNVLKGLKRITKTLRDEGTDV